MKPAFKPVSFPRASDSIERLLSRYYPKLVEWSRILARGDENAADETVQDLCLHLTIARPDFSRVENLDNYLFMCLRNMYVSNLARVSRERLRVSHIEDYDALGMAAADGRIDAVDTQNELVRICAFVLARKYESKSASHFILHFFGGYRRSDVARLARVPISAVYNGLKETRGELREHLDSENKIRVLGRSAKPDLKPLRAALTTAVFLNDLRSAILDGDSHHCIEPSELAAAYLREGAGPVSCEELAHLAGCSDCLKVLERALQLNDSDGPFDGLANPDEAKGTVGKNFDAMMRRVNKRREELLERRPALLAIAADGRVAAFHAIESQHNSLSSRLEAASSVRFVEVFDEFGARLAHIPLEGEYASAQRSRLSQEVFLSDSRRLCLEITFDGLGIHAEVDYTDPALGTDAEATKSFVTPGNTGSFWARLWAPGRFSLAPLGIPALASLLAAVLIGVGVYRYTHPALRDVLALAQAATPAPLVDESLHQILRIEERDGTNEEATVGTVDVWRSKERIVRRLYNTKRQLLATATESPEGTSSVRIEKNAEITSAENALVQSGVWRTEVSAGAFVASNGTRTEASRSLSGYELTQFPHGEEGVLVRILLLDSQYHVRSERIRYTAGSSVHEVRLVQSLLSTVPNRDLPPETFPEAQEIRPSASPGGTAFANEWAGDSPQDAELKVAVLYSLFEQNADVGQPIEVTSGSDGRIRVTGTVADPRLLAGIRENLNALDVNHRLNIHIVSAEQAASESHLKENHPKELEATGGEAPAAQLVRSALLAKGLKGAALQSAEHQFTASALSHAQIALQHAYALDRLGAILRRGGSRQLKPRARLEWSQMVALHAAAATTELEGLDRQLHTMFPDISATPLAEQNGITNGIDNPLGFWQSASALRVEAQSVNEQVVDLFAGIQADMPVAQVRSALGRLRDGLPIARTGQLQTFANRLVHAPGQDELGKMYRR